MVSKTFVSAYRTYLPQQNSSGNSNTNTKQPPTVAPTCPEDEEQQAESSLYIIKVRKPEAKQ